MGVFDCHTIVFHKGHRTEVVLGVVGLSVVKRPAIHLVTLNTGKATCAVVVQGILY